MWLGLYTYLCLLYFKSVSHLGCYIIQSGVPFLYSRSLLVICVKYSHVHMGLFITYAHFPSSSFPF